MGIVVSSRSYTPAPEGIHDAICVDVIELGKVQTAYGARDMIRLVWELNAKMDDGRPFSISRRYTRSLHEKSALHRDLKAWRGRPFTSEELAGFDVENVLGKPCQIIVTHETRDGKTYGNIQTVLKADPTHTIKPSGQYIRMKDRTEETAVSEVSDDDVPF